MIIGSRDLPLKKKNTFFSVFWRFSAFLTLQLVLNYFKLVNFGHKYYILLKFDEINYLIPLYYPNFVSKHIFFLRKNVFFGISRPFLLNNLF